MPKKIEVITHDFELNRDSFDNKTGLPLHGQWFYLAADGKPNLAPNTISVMCLHADHLPLYRVKTNLSEGNNREHYVSREEFCAILDRKRVHPQVAEAITKTISPDWVVSITGAIIEARPYVAVVKRVDLQAEDDYYQIQLTGSFRPRDDLPSPLKLLSAAE